MCRRAGLAAGQPSATDVGGTAWGDAASNAPAGWGGVGCVHTHAALVGPASSLAGRLRQGDAILLLTSGVVHRWRQAELLLVPPVAQSASVEWPVEAPMPWLCAPFLQNITLQCLLLTVLLLPPTPLPPCAAAVARVRERHRAQRQLHAVPALRH